MAVVDNSLLGRRPVVAVRKFEVVVHTWVVGRILVDNTSAVVEHKVDIDSLGSVA